MNTKEGRDRCVDPRHLHHDEAHQRRAAPGASVSLVRKAGDTERRDLRYEIEREFVTLPEIVDDRLHLRFHECAYLQPDVVVLLGERVSDEVEVTVRLGKWL